MRPGSPSAEDVNKDIIDTTEILGFEWIPYRCSVIANRVSACLQSMYGERFQLSVPGWRVMFVLGQHSPLAAKEVGQRTAMDQVQVTRAINQMASVGLISRRVDPADRRRVVLRLSKRGLEAYSEIVPLALKIEAAIVSSLQPSEIEQFSSLLGRVLVSVEEKLADDTDWRSFLPETAAD
jgi:DNA-binding MarR family transcriptional regulator